MFAKLRAKIRNFGLFYYSAKLASAYHKQNNIEKLIGGRPVRKTYVKPLFGKRQVYTHKGSKFGSDHKLVAIGFHDGLGEPW